MKAIQLPEFIFVEVAGRLLMIRTTLPHYIGEVVRYHSAEEMYQAVGLLYTEHTPYITLNGKNVAIIFSGAMGKVPLIPALMDHVRLTIQHMADHYLTQLKETENEK